MLRELAASVARSPTKVAIIKRLYQEEILTITDLSRQLKKNKSTILRHVKSLEKAHIVQSKKAQTDQRMFLLSLTKEGKEIVRFITNSGKLEPM